jgi:hypothetical protein
LILVLVLAPAATATAQFKPIDGHLRPSREAVNVERLGDLRAFRNQALALQRADGGTLTAAHLRILQAKLDRLNAAYRDRLRSTDPLSINADGSLRH